MNRDHDMSEADEPIEEQLPPYVIEGARSSRSKCKTCRRSIDKGALRIGDDRLEAGDGAAIEDEATLSVVAEDSGAELVLWDLPRDTSQGIQ